MVQFKSLNYGIFSLIRNKSITKLPDSYVKVTSPSSYWTTDLGNSYFCLVDPIIGGPPNVVVDGSLTTAWTPFDDKSETNKYLDFDFKTHKIFIKSFGIQTLCGPPIKIKLVGSNDEGQTWQTIYENDETTIIKDNDINYFECSLKDSFKLFRLQQIGQNTHNNYRFHIHNVEFYGNIGKTIFEQKTCNDKSHIIFVVFIVIFIIHVK